MASILGSLPIFKGKKPRVPAFEPVDIEGEQASAIAQNIAAFPSAAELAGSVNKFNQDQLNTMLRSVVPGYDAMLRKGSETIESFMGGEIPQDVQGAIARSGAARALGGGFAGGGMHRNLVARDLGLTSLNLTQQGLSSAERWLSFARQNLVAPQMDVTSMFVTPQQRMAIRSDEAAKKWEVAWLKSKISAAPEPWLAAIGNTLDDIADTALSMLASYGGGMMGGGGGGGQQSPRTNPSMTFQFPNFSGGN